jgi:formate hydrogenlyase regulatory protein HycA
MDFPEKIPVCRDEFYMKNIGHAADGRQFMGFVVATLPMRKLDEDWPRHKRWYAVLHIFDDEGTHLRSDHWFSGTTADGEDTVCAKAKSKLKKMITQLGHVTFDDVAVRLFSVTIEGHRFGMIADEEFGTVSLEPNDFVFYPPWDGEYDT